MEEREAGRDRKEEKEQDIDLEQEVKELGN